MPIWAQLVAGSPLWMHWRLIEAAIAVQMIGIAALPGAWIVSARSCSRDDCRMWTRSVNGVAGGGGRWTVLISRVNGEHLRCGLRSGVPQ